MHILLITFSPVMRRRKLPRAGHASVAPYEQNLRGQTNMKRYTYNINVYTHTHADGPYPAFL